MDENELQSLYVKKYIKFDRWIKRSVGKLDCAHNILIGIHLEIAQEILYEFKGNETIEPLMSRFHKVERWKSFIMEEFNQYENKEDFNKWVIKNHEDLDEIFINYERSRILKEIL